MNFLVRHKSYLLAAIIVAGVWIAYALGGHAFVESIHAGRAPALLSALLPDRADTPLSIYLRLADFLVVFLGFLAFAIAWWIDSWQEFKPLVRQLTVFTLIHVFVLQGLIAITSPERLHDTVLRRTKQFFIVEEHADSWNPMFAAYRHARHLTTTSRPLYEDIFFTQHTKFQYAPTALLVMPVLERLMADRDWKGRLTGLSRYISWVFILLTVCLSALILMRESARELYPAGLPARDKAALITLGIVLSLTFYPTMRSYSLGQLQTWINGLLVVALACYTLKAEVAAGWLSGVACLMKPTHGVLGLWGLVRGHRRFFIGFLIASLGGLALSIRLFGWADHLDYLRVLRYLSQHGEGFFPNQSINGILNRLLGNGPNLEWDAKGFPPYHPVVYFGTLLSSLAFLGGLLVWPAVRRLKGEPLEFALAVLTATMASPIAWEHHYGPLIAIYAVTLPAALRKRPFGRWTVPYLIASFVLTANYWTLTNNTAIMSGAWNLVQSHLFFGSLLLMGLIYACLARPEPDAAR